MTKKCCLFFMFLLFNMAFSVAYATATPNANQEPEIRVGLLTNQPSINVSADSDYELVNRETGHLLGRFKAKEILVISVKNDLININGLPIGVEKLGVIILSNSHNNYIRINNRRYRGDIDLHRTVGGTGLTVVNTLPVEQYLYGIIAKEISPEWHMEAVKAQAVAARTYALYGFDKHKGDGYDVCATVHCQVYGGRESEVSQALKAVDDTRGLVMVYNGKLIPAYFHSSSGGYTEHSENVWNSHQPYLRGVVDYDQNSPYFKWQKILKSQEFETLLRKAGYNVGKLTAIELSPLGKPPLSAADRGISGRVKTLKVIGSDGSAVITGARLRSILGLHSTLFELDITAPEPKVIDFTVTANSGDRLKKRIDVILAPLAPIQEKAPVLNKGNIRQVKGLADEEIVITGYGWGHGIGLSQWGAKAMAESSPPGDTTYFQVILKHYYQGVDIHKAY